MDRRDFLNRVGVGAAFALTAVCIGGCIKKDMIGPPEHVTSHLRLPGEENIDFTIDISEPQYANLKWEGGWVIVQEKVVVAKTESSNQYVAASRMCSDEILPGIIYSGDEWYCTEHDATFDLQGKGTQTFNNKGFRGLRIYNTALNGNQLRIFSV